MTTIPTPTVLSSAITTNAPTRRTLASNIIPFLPRITKVEYAAGVMPFDPTNPGHIKVWNAVHALGWAEQAARRDAK
jgi:hypothetical protein